MPNNIANLFKVKKGKKGTTGSTIVVESQRGRLRDSENLYCGMIGAKSPTFPGIIDDLSRFLFYVWKIQKIFCLVTFLLFLADNCEHLKHKFCDSKSNHLAYIKNYKFTISERRSSSSLDFFIFMKLFYFTAKSPTASETLSLRYLMLSKLLRPFLLSLITGVTEIAAFLDRWLKIMNDENASPIIPPTMPIHFETELNFFALRLTSRKMKQMRKKFNDAIRLHIVDMD